jgi:hypothetical protein
MKEASSVTGSFARRIFGSAPSFWRAWAIFLVPALLLFTRHVLTEFVFDEQPALRANPYLRDPSIGWTEAWSRDFWGLPPEATIGSYRPLPSLVWRALTVVGDLDYSPFFHHLFNVFLHAANAALFAIIVLAATRRTTLAWLAGGLFVTCAVSTEAVCSVVGLADVLSTFWLLLAVCASTQRIPRMVLAIFAATLFAVLSKESAAAIVVGVPLVTYVARPLCATNRSALWRASAALGAALAAFAIAVTLRRALFPATPMLAESTPFASVLRWYAQPAFNIEPVSNPLATVTTPYRVAGALRVFTHGAAQLLFPWPLSADYSAQQEMPPLHLVSIGSVVGALLLLGPVASGLALAASTKSYTRRILAAALLWTITFYVPVSNLAVLLPTVRAERFWYAPSLGTSLILALGADAALSHPLI